MNYSKNNSEDRGIKIDKDIKLFLEKAVEHAGSMRKLASIIDVYATSVSRWLGNVAGQTVECIDWPNWEKLWRYMSMHRIIDSSDVRWMPPSALREALATGAPVKTPPGSEVSFEVPTLKKYPVISMAAAAEVNTCYYPLAEFAIQNAEDMATFTAGNEGDFVIRVHGDSMKPWYPPGTLLLVRPNQRLRDGDRVIAVLADGSVIFKCFIEKKTTFMLLSINGEDGCNLEIAKDDYMAIRDIYKVVQSLRTEDALDAAMREKGHVHFWMKYKNGQ